MRFLLSWLKEYVELPVHPEGLARQLTMSGLEVTELTQMGEDWRFEAEVTPNRPDLLSHFGIARETAATLGRTFRAPRWLQRELALSRAKQAPFPVILEDPKGCLRYVGIVMEGVAVRPSPPEVAQRLERLGVRPVNNVVDATNFVLLELGQPLHAFDLDRLEGGRVVVRRARPGETLSTLDGIRRELKPDWLVIADAKKPAALAGVMGGEGTQITGATRRIFLESAWFDPALIRRASRMTGLVSESSYRFERGVDPAMVPAAAARAARLILKYAGGTWSGDVTDVGMTRVPRRQMRLRLRQAQALLGMRIYPSQAKQFLERLGCVVKGNARSFQVEIPSWRADLKRPEDLHEELARLWGYERCIPTLPPLARRAVLTVGAVAGAARPAGGRSSKQKRAALRQIWQPLGTSGFWRELEIRRYLSAAGFQEIITYSLLGREALARCRWSGGPDSKQSGGLQREPVSIQNPLSLEQACLRPLLFPGALETLSRNVRRKTAQAFRFFEMGRVFDPSRPLRQKTDPNGGATHPAERRSLSFLLAGTPDPQWGRPSKALGTFDLKGVVRFLCERLRLQPLKEQLLEAGPAYLAGKVIAFYLDKAPLGTAGRVDPALLSEVELPQELEVAYAELDLDLLLRHAPAALKAAALAKVPPVTRDLAVVVPEEVAHGELERVIREAGSPLLEEAVLFDLYRGNQVAAGKKSLAFRLSFSDGDRTLTDGEIASATQKILDQLQTSFKAAPR